MKKLIITGALCTAISLPLFQVQAQESAAPQAAPGLTHAMSKSVDPQVYTSLMTQMMTNPMGVMMNPISTCAQCHSAEDMARYTKSLGPMMQMGNPANMINPNAYTKMMAVPVDPETYTKWYEAWMQKFGGMAGQQAAPAE